MENFTDKERKIAMDLSAEEMKIVIIALRYDLDENGTKENKKELLETFCRALNYKTH